VLIVGQRAGIDVDLGRVARVRPQRMCTAMWWARCSATLTAASADAELRHTLDQRVLEPRCRLLGEANSLATASLTSIARLSNFAAVRGSAGSVWLRRPCGHGRGRSTRGSATRIGRPREGRDRRRPSRRRPCPPPAVATSSVSADSVAIRTGSALSINQVI
jgi:hypothetical protein